MLDKVKLLKEWNGKMKVTPQELIEIQHDSHSHYARQEYIEDLIMQFEATEEEAEKIVDKYFIRKNGRR